MECFIRRGEQFPRESMHPHHIQPRAYGGPDTPENIVWICSDVHDILHRLAVKLAAKASMVGEAKHILEKFLPGQPARQERLWKLAVSAARAQLQHVRTGDIPEAGLEEVDVVKIVVEAPVWLHHRLKTLSVGTGLQKYVLRLLQHHATVAIQKPGADFTEKFDTETPASPDRPLFLIDPTQPK